MSLKTTTGRVLCKVIPKEQKTASGIFLGYVEGHSKLVRDVYPDTGFITFITDKDSEDTGLRVGDTVSFGRWGAKEVKEDVVNIRLEDVFARLE